MKSSTFFSEFVGAAKQAPRIYFAPLVGAIKAIKAELALAADGERPARTSKTH